MTTKSDSSKEQFKARYSDEELQEFRELIMKKLEKARHDLELLTDAFTGKNENDTLDTSPTFKVLEEGYSVLSKEENSHLASRQQKFIKSLEAALIRIENKTYGICRATGNLISKERLRAVPHATLSIEAKLQQKPVSKFPPLPESMKQQDEEKEE
jgi:DnaK suppressor protein